MWITVASATALVHGVGLVHCKSSANSTCRTKLFELVYQNSGSRAGCTRGHQRGPQENQEKTKEEPRENQEGTKQEPKERMKNKKRLGSENVMKLIVSLIQIFEGNEGKNTRQEPREPKEPEGTNRKTRRKPR